MWVLEWQDSGGYVRKKRFSSFKQAKRFARIFEKRVLRLYYEEGGSKQ